MVCPPPVRHRAGVPVPGGLPGLRPAGPRPADGLVARVHGRERDHRSRSSWPSLRRCSLRVAKGQRVAAGEQVAECGNSGNSTEPHLHFQLQDHPSVLFAAGLPFTAAAPVRELEDRRQR